MQLIKRGSALFKRDKKPDGDGGDDKKDDKDSHKEKEKPVAVVSSSKLLAPPPGGAGISTIAPKLGDTSEVHRTYARDFKSLPVHKDLPRLAPNISIATKNESDGQVKVALAKPQPPIDKTKRIHDVLITLASLLDGPEVEKVFRENAAKHITEPIAAAMIEFFKSVDDGSSPKLKTLRLLKACNQSVVAPIFVDLQLNLSSRFPYGDGGKWDVEVLIQPNRVTLSHVRLERSLNALFEFQWRIVFVFDRDVTTLQHVYYFIERITFSNTDHSSQQVKELQDMLQSIDLGTLYREISSVWQKPNHQLPIHKDLPGVASQTSFLPAISTDSNSTSKTSTTTELETLLLHLCQRFSTAEKVSIVQSKYKEVVQPQHLDQTVKSFLRENLQIKDNDRLTGVLKCLNTSIIAPVVCQLQTTVGQEYPFKDRLVARSESGSTTRHANAFESSLSSVQNSWKISIDTRDAKVVVITHTKQESTIESSNPEKSFLFEWKVQLRFDSQMSQLEAVECSLGEIVFHKDCSAAAREKIRAALSWALRIQWWNN